jgi:hypothetical protein
MRLMLADSRKTVGKERNMDSNSPILRILLNNIRNGPALPGEAISPRRLFSDGIHIYAIELIISIE